MSDFVAVTSLTLDGVMQAPGRPDEDLVLGSAADSSPTAAHWPRSDSSRA